MENLDPRERAPLMPGRRAVRLFVTSVTVFAAGVSVIELLLREPGVALADGLPAAAVTVAAAAGAIGAAPRMKRGVLACAALAFSALSLVVAATSLAALVGGDNAAASWIWIMLAPAGLCLLALGAWELWSSRKSSGHWIARRTFIAFVGVVCLFEFVLPLGLAWLATHRPDGGDDRPALRQPFESVAIETADGLTLSGSYAPARNGMAILTFPAQEASERQAQMLAGAGFGVLALDMRGYGASEGAPNAYGWGATADIDAGVAFLSSQPGVASRAVGGLGLSVGGEQLLEAAANNPALRAVVSEGAGERSVRETLLYGPAAALVIPHQAVLTAAVAVLSGEPPPPALDDVAREIAPRAAFFIRAEDGHGGEELNADYFEAAGEPKQYWKVDGAGHTGGIDAAPAQYRQRIIGFFKSALSSGSG